MKPKYLPRTLRQKRRVGPEPKRWRRMYHATTALENNAEWCTWSPKAMELAKKNMETARQIRSKAMDRARKERSRRRWWLW